MVNHWRCHIRIKGYLNNSQIRIHINCFQNIFIYTIKMLLKLLCNRKKEKLTIVVLRVNISKLIVVDQLTKALVVYVIELLPLLDIWFIYCFNNVQWNGNTLINIVAYRLIKLFNNTKHLAKYRFATTKWIKLLYETQLFKIKMHGWA